MQDGGYAHSGQEMPWDPIKATPCMGRFIWRLPIANILVVHVVADPHDRSHVHKRSGGLP